MKHIFLPLIFLCSVELSAQVGIGTNTPLSKLHVLGNASPIARIENYTLNTPSEILQLSFNNISFPALALFSGLAFTLSLQVLIMQSIFLKRMVQKKLLLVIL